MQVDSLPVKPQGKPNNPGVGSLFLLQRIFLTQESNRDFLHCRWIVYQLSYQGETGRQRVNSHTIVLSLKSNVMKAMRDQEEDEMALPEL